MTELTRVGNLGCIRFPLPIRQASGIKRGHRLAVTVERTGAIVLAKLPDGLPMEGLSVDECACQQKPEGCRVPTKYLEVGWSYVQFDAARATDLGLLPGVPLTLVAEPFRITVAVAGRLARKDREAIEPVRCPP